MTDFAEPWSQLRLHPRCQAVLPDDKSRRWVKHVEALARWRKDGQLDLSWCVTGEIGGLVVPPPGRRQRRNDLWRSTCFEAFVAPIEAGGYRGGPYAEVNVSPSGAWAVYAFDGYRRGCRDLAQAAARYVEANASAAQLEVHAVMTGVPLLSGEATQIALGLSAVIEDIDGDLSYWALAHGPGAPDFHHASAFAATVLRGA